MAETAIKAAEAAKKTTTTRLLEDQNYPSEMRRQMWPLCCGASILSGLKRAHELTQPELVAEINRVINDTLPDLQIFAGEQMRPHLTFLTLNSTQCASPKIMAAIEECGFVLLGKGKPRGGEQQFFVRDTSNSFSSAAVVNGKALKAA